MKYLFEIPILKLLAFSDINSRKNRESCPLSKKSPQEIH